MLRTAQHAENPYDRFAAIYNSHWGPNSLRFVPSYLEHALGHLSVNSRVLDLCCGTGQLAAALTQRGYRILGVDSSEKMLAFAGSNAPQAGFVRDDVRNFVAEPRFDAAVCVYDSLNHLLTFNDLIAAFETAFLCLKWNGVFAFDMNMAAKYRDSWRGEFAISGSDEVYEIVSRVDPTQRVATLAASRKPHLNFDGGDDRILFRQAWYSEVEIVRGLKAAGFGRIKAVSLNAPELNDPERMLFVCRKP